MAKVDHASLIVRSVLDLAANQHRKSSGGEILNRKTPTLFLCNRRREPAKGLLAGLVGGLIGTIVMTEFQNAWSKASKALKDNNRGQDKQGSQSQSEAQPEKEDATMKAAGRLAGLAGRRLSHEQKKKVSPIVHYSFGTLQGAAYGTITEFANGSGGLLPGVLFGASLFVVADEITVPTLGLSPRPTESPLSSHLYGLAAHLVYGVSTEIVRRGLRAVL